MKVSLKVLFGTAVLLAALFLTPSSVSYGVWIWTPETGWYNPKYAVKETPEEQYAWAQSFEEEKDYKRAIWEHKKLIYHFPDSPYAAKSCYALGEIYEKLGKILKAADEYQRVIEDYPNSELIKDAIAKLLEIGDSYFEREDPPKIKKILSRSKYEQAAGVYGKVVKNAPYEDGAAKAQYRIGLCYFKQGLFSEAASEYEKLLDNYPESDFVEHGLYELCLCYFHQSLSPLYDQTTTDKALKKLIEFTERFPQGKHLSDAKEKIAILKGKKAEKTYRIAQFYQRRGSNKAALIYYQEILDTYPETKWSSLAREGIAAIKVEE